MKRQTSKPNNKITLTIECTGKEIETANFLLGQAYKSAIDNEKLLNHWDVTAAQLKHADTFRKKFLDAYFKLNN